MSMRHPFTFSRTGILVICLAASASLRAGQQPAPGTADQPSGVRPLPRTPNTQFPRPQLDRQFQIERPALAVPEINQFPPFKTGGWKLAAPVLTEAARADAPRVVCGMIVVPGNADLDRKILREVPPDAPKGVIRSVEGKCDSALAVTVDPAHASGR